MHIMIVYLYLSRLLSICDLIFKKLPQNNFDQMLIFNHSPFHQFAQEVNALRYPGSDSTNLLRYQISLTYCIKWWNDK